MRSLIVVVLSSVVVLAAAGCKGKASKQDCAEACTNVFELSVQASHIKELDGLSDAERKTKLAEFLAAEEMESSDSYRRCDNKCRKGSKLMAQCLKDATSFATVSSCYKREQDRKERERKRKRKRGAKRAAKQLLKKR